MAWRLYGAASRRCEETRVIKLKEDVVCDLLVVTVAHATLNCAQCITSMKAWHIHTEVEVHKFTEKVVLRNVRSRQTLFAVMDKRGHEKVFHTLGKVLAIGDQVLIDCLEKVREVARTRATSLRLSFADAAKDASLSEFAKYANNLGDLPDKDVMKQLASLLNSAEAMSVYTKCKALQQFQPYSESAAQTYRQASKEITESERELFAYLHGSFQAPTTLADFVQDSELKDALTMLALLTAMTALVRVPRCVSSVCAKSNSPSSQAARRSTPSSSLSPQLQTRIPPRPRLCRSQTRSLLRHPSLPPSRPLWCRPRHRRRPRRRTRSLKRPLALALRKALAGAAAAVAAPAETFARSGLFSSLVLPVSVASPAHDW